MAFLTKTMVFSWRVKLSSTQPIAQFPARCWSTASILPLQHNGDSNRPVT